MTSQLTTEHFNLIRGISQIVSKGVNADDLSQHVIMKLLQKDTQFINGLISRGKEFNGFMWRFIGRMHMHSGSSYNVVETETYDPNQRKIKVGYDKFVEVGYVDVSDHKLDFYELISRIELTDLERMYLNAYIESGCSYTTCSSNLDIHYTTIRKYIRRIIEKCKESL